MLVVLASVLVLVLSRGTSKPHDPLPSTAVVPSEIPAVRSEPPRPDARKGRAPAVEAGGVSGASPVIAAAAGHDETVDLELVEGVLLEGTILSGQDRLGIAGATIALYPEGWSLGEATWQTVSGDDGSYRLRGLRPGRYEVLVQASEHDLLRDEVFVGAFATTRMDFLLGTVPVGDVSGVLRGYDGDAARPCTLVLRSKARAGVVRTAAARFEPSSGGPKVGVFTFERVPIEDYELSVFPFGGDTFVPAAIDVRPPRSDLVFTRRAPAAVESLGFVVRDGVGGDVLQDFDVFLFRKQRVTHRFRRVEAGAVLLPDQPVGEPLEWMVVKDGYQPVWGDERAFTQRDPTLELEDGSRRRTSGLFADLVLQPGLGVELHVVSPAGDLADALIHLDGVEAARTDENGRARIAWPAKPDRIEVFHPDGSSRTVDVPRSSAGGEGESFALVVRLPPPRRR